MKSKSIILAATDFSRTGNDAVAYAMTLASRLGDEAVLLHAFDGPFVLPSELTHPPTVMQIRRRAEGLERELQQIVQAMGRNCVPVHCVAIHGIAREVIPRFAVECGAELVVVGQSGQGSCSGFFLGSVAEAVARRSPVPVLIVRSNR
jgi:nucleotide-binding universal stress UspA family protein